LRGLEGFLPASCNFSGTQPAALKAWISANLRGSGHFWGAPDRPGGPAADADARMRPAA